jgi:glycerol uptake facilitator-like aquaporin
MFGKRNIAALVAEFLGTGILTLLVLSVQRSTIGVPFFVAIAAGLTVAMGTFVFAQASGAHFNPAITIAQWTVRKIATLKAVLYVAAQLAGAWAAYWLYTYYVQNTLSPIGGDFTKRILLAEFVGTLIFSFGWAAAQFQNFSVATTAAVRGISYMLGIIATSAAALALLNPAVALGVRAWVWLTYVLGPILGAVIGMNLYALLFAEPTAVVSTSASTAVKVTKVTTVKKVAAKKKPAAKKKTATRKK